MSSPPLVFAQKVREEEQKKQVVRHNHLERSLQSNKQPGACSGSRVVPAHEKTLKDHSAQNKGAFSPAAKQRLRIGAMCLCAAIAVTVGVECGLGKCGNSEVFIPTPAPTPGWFTKPPTKAPSTSPQNSSVAHTLSFGNVIFLRHALAPGGGDPLNFDINDCSTQRNLDAAGRQQAISLGKALKAQAKEFPIKRVYTSMWCRCKETAMLMDMGPHIQELEGLNSFFDSHTHIDKDGTLAKLRRTLADLPDDGGMSLMVTHQVTIAAITGRAVESGGTVGYDLKQGRTATISLDMDP